MMAAAPGRVMMSAINGSPSTIVNCTIESAVDGDRRPEHSGEEPLRPAHVLAVGGQDGDRQGPVQPSRQVPTRAILDVGNHDILLRTRLYVSTTPGRRKVPPNM
jgi:hypothetical protein